MKKISEKLRKDCLEKFKPLITQLVSEGCDQGRIVQAAKAYTDAKIRSYYKKIPQRISIAIDKGLEEAKEWDSKAEVVFYKLLEKHGIDFKYHYPVGPYVGDYLVGSNLIVELDGPQHDTKRDERRDKYLNKMGYRVLRVPIFVVSIDSESVIKEIKLAAEDLRELTTEQEG
jgi:very-short-patch-repair endonuclease